MKNDLIFLAVVILTLLFIIEYSKTYDQIADFKLDANYVKDFAKTLNWIKENTGENDAFFTEWKDGTLITGYAGRKAIATSKVYPSEAMIVGERYKEISRFFFTDKEKDALELMRRYNATYVMVQKDFSLKNCGYIKKCSPENHFSSNQFSGDPIITEKYMAGRFLENSNLHYFRLVYSSDFFKIYKVDYSEKDNFTETINLDSGFYEFKDIIEKDFLNSQGKELKNVRGAVLPHDMTYSHSQIARFLSALQNDYSTIIIIGPDHEYLSKDFAITSARNWTTPFGLLEADNGKIRKLGMKESDFVMLNEWSIRVLLPFIKFKFPDAKIIPLLVRDDIDSNKYINLGRKIAEISDDETLILLSLDFSHIDGMEDTKLNLEQDMKSAEIMKSLDLKKVQEMEVEARNPVYVFLSTMKGLGATKLDLVSISNAIHIDNGRGVGYILAAYKK